MSERAILLGRLAEQRRHVLEALDGLDDAQLRLVRVPSGWSPVELVRHLTLGVERYWFHTVTGGAALDYWPSAPAGFPRPADWFVPDDELAGSVVREYRDAIAGSDEIIASLDLDAAPARPEDWWPAAGLEFPDLRSVLLHAIVDTATHAGQLDVVREVIDGRQHLVL